MGEKNGLRKQEVAALRAGIDLGMTLIDTAEMYGEGRAEEVVAEAIQGQRDRVFLVSKVLPHNATSQGTIDACERSLRRLKTDHLDLYLLHWRGSVPIEETLEGLQTLVREGMIREYGVSNFDQDDMEEAAGLSGGAKVATNQVLYNPLHRGIEWDLLLWLRERKIPIMAYSPIEQGEVLDHPTLKTVAARHQATPAQVVLAWTMHEEDVISIPKAGQTKHVRENFDALAVKLTKEDLREIDVAFPPPTRKISLEMK